LAPSGAPLRVLIVDDSAIVRGMMSRWFSETTDLEVVGVATDGAQAIQKTAALCPDVCVLDIEMPVMGGLEALPVLLKTQPGLRVVIASTLTVKGGEVALRALDLGAADYIAKPSSTGLGGATAYRDELIDKLRRLGAARRHVAAAPRLPVTPALAPAAGAVAQPITAAEKARVFKPSLTVIAASTGGPPALREVLKGLGRTWPTPIMIVQHMPTTFTQILAEHLNKNSGVPTREAADGDVVLPGHAYIAPGGWHMRVSVEGGRPVARLGQEPAENWCRPAADPLFRSAAAAYHDRVLAIVLTGMGADGREGARMLAAQRSYVIVQDEGSSVVWGMPGSVVAAGLADEVKSLEAIPASAWSLVRGVSNAS